MRALGRAMWLALAVLVALYTVGANAAFWVWVANSAFRGIRDTADPRLGVFSAIVTMLPVVGATVALLLRRRYGGDWLSGATWGAWAATLIAMPFLLFAIAKSVI